MTIDGILLLDKPTGITSNKALQSIKRLYQARKAGHTGSLDPLASGMLPIMLGKATRLSRFLLGADKCYQVTARLGIETTTGDAEGEPIKERNVVPYRLDTIHTVLSQFRGAIEQVPPMYSALKHQGQPLYKLARKGIEVPRNKRKMTIHQLLLTTYTAETLSLEVVCSSGTYIRTLVTDIGNALGCGAHVTQLRRLYVVPYTTAMMYSLETLQATDALESLIHYLLPLDTACANLPVVTLDTVISRRICQGQRIPITDSIAAPYLRLYSEDETFLGIGRYLDDGVIRPDCILTHVN